MLRPAPPPPVVAELHRYDPALRLRFGVHSHLWIIERKVPPRHAWHLGAKPNPYRSDRGKDRFDGWKDGYTDVMFVHQDLLGSPAMWETLTQADLHRQGGIEAINRRLDAEAEAEEAQIQKDISYGNLTAAEDMYDRIAWLDGRRVAVPNDDPVTPRHAVESHEGFIVHDRRVRV